MSDFDWSRFRVRIGINAPAENLYKAWATRAGIEHWFLRLSEYRGGDGVLRKNDEPAEKGDSYLWRWHGWPDEVEEKGEILDTNGKDLFAFRFGEAGNCTVRIYPEGTLTMVELVQDQIPVNAESMHNWHLGCKTGWTFYMANLKSLFEGGLDLRNKDINLREVLNA